MALRLIRRHLKDCPHTSTTYRRCRCPIHVYGSLAGEKIRKALDQTSWEAASELITAWTAAGEIGVVKVQAPTVTEAVEKYLADCEARQLGWEAMRKYRHLLEHAGTRAAGAEQGEDEDCSHRPPRHGSCRGAEGQVRGAGRNRHWCRIPAAPTGAAERWQSGRMYLTRNQAWAYAHRGFESHPLRHLPAVPSACPQATATPAGRR